MKFIDTHSHIYDKEFEQDLNQVVGRALTNGVYKILLPNVDTSTIDPLIQTCKKFNCLYPMMGLHPTSVNEDWEEELKRIKETLYTQKDLFCAVGEIGIDLYWDKTFCEEQIEALRHQMLWSFDLDLPVSIHNRKAFDEFYALLKRLNKPTYKGVMHCFGGDLNQAEALLEMGFYIGVGGVMTFKNAHLVDVIKKISLDRIVLETDAPYLAPVPYRGKRNESAYIPLIAQKLAEIKQCPIEEVAAKTTTAALKLFEQLSL